MTRTKIIMEKHAITSYNDRVREKIAARNKYLSTHRLWGDLTDFISKVESVRESDHAEIREFIKGGSFEGVNNLVTELVKEMENLVEENVYWIKTVRGV